MAIKEYTDIKEKNNVNFIFKAASFIALCIAGYVSTKWTLQLFEGLGVTPQEKTDFFLLGIVFESFKYILLHIGFKKFRADKIAEAVIYSLTGVILVIISFGATVGLQKYTQEKNQAVAVNSSDSVKRLRSEYKAIQLSIDKKIKRAEYFDSIDRGSKAEKIEKQLPALRTELSEKGKEIKNEIKKTNGAEKTTIGGLISELAWWLGLTIKQTSAYVKAGIAGLSEWLAFLGLLIISDKKSVPGNLSRSSKKTVPGNVKTQENLTMGNLSETVKKPFPGNLFFWKKTPEKTGLGNLSENNQNDVKLKLKQVLAIDREMIGKPFRNDKKTVPGNLSQESNFHPVGTVRETFPKRSENLSRERFGNGLGTVSEAVKKESGKGLGKVVGKVSKSKKGKKTSASIKKFEDLTPDEQYEAVKDVVMSGVIKTTNEAIRKYFRVRSGRAKEWLLTMEKDNYIELIGSRWKLK